MANLRGKWTVPGSPLPSSHLISLGGNFGLRTRCGLPINEAPNATDEPRGRTCENCLKWSRQDG